MVKCIAKAHYREILNQFLNYKWPMFIRLQTGKIMQNKFPTHAFVQR